MSGTYTPIPNDNAVVTSVVDGDNGDAASVRVWLESLSDLGAFLRLAPALNWPIKGTTTNNLKRAVFEQKTQTWIAVGDGAADYMERTQDGGRTWDNVATGAPLNAAITLIDITCKQSTGDLIAIASGSRTVYRGIAPSPSYGWETTLGNWTAQANALSASPSGGAVDFESTAGKYIAVYRVGATGMRVDYSTTGLAAWTAGTPPAAWTAYTGANNPEITCIAGRAIAVFFDENANLYRTAYSTDGGSTWTEVTFAGTTFNPQNISKPTYNPAKDEWYFVGSTNSGSSKTEMFKTANGGVSWSSVVNLTTRDMAISDMQALSDLLFVGVDYHGASTSDGKIYYSTDRGANWLLAGRNNVSVAARPFLRSGGGRLMMLVSSDKTSFTSLRLGAGLAV